MDVSYKLLRYLQSTAMEAFSSVPSSSACQLPIRELIGAEAWIFCRPSEMLSASKDLVEGYLGLQLCGITLSHLVICNFYHDSNVLP